MKFKDVILESPYFGALLAGLPKNDSPQHQKSDGHFYGSGSDFKWLRSEKEHGIRDGLKRLKLMHGATKLLTLDAKDANELSKSYDEWCESNKSKWESEDAEAPTEQDYAWLKGEIV